MSKQVPNNTMPVVEPDIPGGHEPYVRVDSSTPATTTSQPAGGPGPVTPLPVSYEMLYEAVCETNDLLRRVIVLLQAVMSP